jgi:hypothetical protein
VIEPTLQPDELEPTLDPLPDASRDLSREERAFQRRRQAAMWIGVDLLTVEALSLGEPVPTGRILPEWVKWLDLNGESFLLSDEGARRIELIRRDKLVRHPAEAAEHHSTAQRSWRPIDLRAADMTPPVEPTLAGLVYRGGARHLFSGEPESGKTLAAFALGLEEIRAGGRVLHLDFEMFVRRTRERLRELGATDRELAEWIHVEPDAAPSEADLASLLALAPTVAIVDASAGVYAALGLDDNSRLDVERYARTIVDPLAHARVSTITLDHVAKAREQRGRFAIGSERKAGGADVHLSFEAVRRLHRGGSGLVRITVAKDRDGFLPRPTAADLELVSDPETHAIVWTFTAPAASADEWRPTVLMERVSHFLEQQPAPVSRTFVEQHVTGKGKYLRHALDTLRDEGFVHEERGSGSSRLVSLVKPFVPSVPGPSQSVPESGPSVRPSVPRPQGRDGDEGQTDFADEVERLAEIARRATEEKL